MNLKEILQEAEKLQDKINKTRPITGRNLEKIKDYWRIGLTYSSNALEGNTLTQSETKVILEDGITVGGKPLRDILECIGHSNAMKFLYEMKDLGDETLILEFHRLFFTGIDPTQAGQYRKTNVIITGTDYKPPPFEKIPALISKTLKALKETHPILAASERHAAVANIHPFIDGNGRTARLIMNFSLLKQGYPVISIPPILRAPYIAACAEGNKGNLEPFYTLMATQTVEAQRDYLRLLA